MKTIGFGGGCHWCTEAVFEFFKGVEHVDQGWIQSKPPFDTFSEGVLVRFNPDLISLEDLIEAHLMTHSSTSDHSMRKKYRSAIYFFNEEDEVKSKNILKNLGKMHGQSWVTQVLPYVDFKRNKESQLHYYKNNKEAPFCSTYIVPKLQKLERRFKNYSKA